MDIPFRFDKSTQEVLLYPKEKNFDNLVQALFRVANLNDAEHYSYDYLDNYEALADPIEAKGFEMRIGKAKISLIPDVDILGVNFGERYRQSEQDKSYRQRLIPALRKELREHEDIAFRWANDTEVPIVYRNVQIQGSPHYTRFFIEIPAHYNTIMNTIDRSGFTSEQYYDYSDIRKIPIAKKHLTPSCDISVRKGVLDVYAHKFGTQVARQLTTVLPNYFPTYQDPTTF